MGFSDCGGIKILPTGSRLSKRRKQEHLTGAMPIMAYKEEEGVETPLDLMKMMMDKKQKTGDTFL